MHEQQRLGRHCCSLFSDFYESFMEPLPGLCVLSYPIRVKGETRKEGSPDGRSVMWIAYAGPERVAEFLHNYQNALGVCGKGSESGSRQESAQPEKSPMTPAAEPELESTKSHEYFAQPGDAEWGC